MLRCMTHHNYYIDTNGSKEGPYDLVTVMRRIRARKIGPDTLIYIDEATTPQPASQITDVALFFTRDEPEPTNTDQLRKRRSSEVPGLSALVAEGWRFTMEHNVMTVYAGALLLVCLLLGAGLVNMLGNFVGGMITWLIFVELHNFYIVFLLRTYRGQTMSSDFVNHQLGPIITKLAIGSLMLAFMMVGGLVFFVIPCFIVSVLYIFVPFLLLDHNFSSIEAMQASRMLLQKRDWRYFGMVSLLVLFHFVCLMLIIPIPLTLPIYAVAISELYEKISAA